MQFINLLNRARQTSARWYIICTTHGTLLMTHSLTRRWLTEPSGTSTLYLFGVSSVEMRASNRQAMTLPATPARFYLPIAAVSSGTISPLPSPTVNDWTGCKQNQIKPTNKKKNKQQQLSYGIHHLWLASPLQ